MIPAPATKMRMTNSTSRRSRPGRASRWGRRGSSALDGASAFWRLIWTAMTASAADTIKTTTSGRISRVTWTNRALSRLKQEKIQISKHFQQPINQSTDQTNDFTINQSINQSINRPNERFHDQSINQSINQSTDRPNDFTINQQSINQSINRLINRTEQYW